MVKCYKCKTPMKVGKTNFEIDGVIIKNVEAEICPKCGEEVFSAEQVIGIRKRFESISPSVKIERKITSASGKKPMIYLPAEVLEAVGMKIGDVVKIAAEGKHKMVITPA